MRIAIGSDHRAERLRAYVRTYLKSVGHQVEDCGCKSGGPSDYSEIALRAAGLVGEGVCDRAILMCGTGIGMSIAANKVVGVRAALCHTTKQCSLSRKHNDANVLCLPGNLASTHSPTLVREMLNAWLKTDHEGERHARRVAIITNYENQVLKGVGP